LKKFFSLAPALKQIQLIGQLIFQLLPYIIVGLVFGAFVVINNGLVVGDRDAHQATVHIPQLFYLFALVTLFAAPHWISLLLPFCKTCLRKWFVISVTIGLVGLIVRYNTLVHPYLLADNRHYTFYIWKRVFEYQSWGRYVIIPLYLFGAFATYRTMSTSKSFIFALAFIICCFVALVPQRLLEIRYFFIPFLFVRLHVAPRSWVALFFEFLIYSALNAATLYLFITRPFYWADSPLVQRFMW
jgi:alpha-1,2-glucosyltransferase